MGRYYLFVKLLLLSGSLFAMSHGGGGGADHEAGDQSARCVQTSIVLVGANGDLAKRYLWQAIFDMYAYQVRDASRDGSSHLVAVCGTRKLLSADVAQQMLADSIVCDDVSESSQCSSSTRSDFINAVLPMQLKSESDYQALDEMLATRATRSGCVEQRLFYLAIPAFAFASTAQYIGSHCRPASNGSSSSWLRVVFEKPFGHDYESSHALTTSLKLHLHDDEILLIDHYMGKTGVRAIQDFRSLLSAESKLWDGSAVSRVEITVSEALDAAGRTRFYDAYGVVRDMLQNHLTSLLTLVACEVGSHGRCTAESMHAVLRAIEPVRPSQVLLGQYGDYTSHCCQDDQANCEAMSRTATFASVLLHVNTREWSGVPFVLASGKSMGERRAFITLHYKANPLDTGSGNSCGAGRRLTINIQGGVHGTHLLIPKHTPSTVVLFPAGWQWTHDVVEEDCHYSVATPEVSARPYSELVRSAVLNPSGQFVDTASLLYAWQAWSSVVEWLDYLPLRRYTAESVEAGHLRTAVTAKTLSFALDALVLSDLVSAGMPHARQLLGGVVFDGSLDIITANLAEDISEQIHASVRDRGSFHLALPGGSSPRPLLLTMASLPLLDTVPWQHIHIWQVDERCVNPVTNASQSNFLQLSSYLLQHRPIPPENIHPMPVLLAHGLCNVEDHGAGAYSEQLRVHNGQVLDMIVLGVGVDGHVASLFPHTAPPPADDTQVMLSQRYGDVPTSTRMTLTFPAISKARSVAFIITGRSKAHVFRQLESADHGTSLPAARVALQCTGRVSWYVDTATLQR